MERLKVNFVAGDSDEESMLEELKAEIETLMTLIKEVLSDKVEKVIAEQITGVPVPKVMTDIVETIQLVRQLRSSCFATSKW